MLVPQILFFRNLKDGKTVFSRLPYYGIIVLSIQRGCYGKPNRTDLLFYRSQKNRSGGPKASFRTYRRICRKTYSLRVTVFRAGGAVGSDTLAALKVIEKKTNTGNTA